MLFRLAFCAASFFIAGAQAAAIQVPLRTNVSALELEPALQELERALPRAPDGRPRIQRMEPVAKACYSKGQNGAIVKDQNECKRVTDHRTGDRFMTNEPGAYYFGNWGGCQRKGKSCVMPALEDTNDPYGSKGAFISAASTCYQGSVPDYYIDVWSAEDVLVVFRKAKTLGMPIVIKNTGHDWKGRSSGPGALALWTHNLQHPRTDITLHQTFRPEGCPDNVPSETVIQFSAGEQWAKIYSFADERNLTVLGGTCPTVGVAGWVQGGGHSPLSPSKGLGVDHIRQIRIVTPNAQNLIANEYQNQDIFHAIKGGGGGTFGVIMEIWYKATARYPVHEFNLDLWGLDAHEIRRFIQILADNANKWAKNGWGGYINTIRQSRTVTIINPRISVEEATSDMEPLINFARELRIAPEPEIITRNSWYEYFQGVFGTLTYHTSLWSTAVASRLIPADIFNDEVRKRELVDILVDLHYSRVGFIIMPVTPSALDQSEVQPSMLHPTWRTATWLIRINDRWDSFYQAATPHSNYMNFHRVHNAIDRVRKLTPNMGVSINEADIWEPRHELSYWGADNYELLRTAKRKYDPEHVLRVYNGVGTMNWEDRFKCYPRIDDY